MTISSTQPTSDFSTQPEIELQLYTETTPIKAAAPVNALSVELIEAFAAATGWELARVGNKIKIVDMSQNWPAKTPTASRAKCDRFADVLSESLRN